MAFFNVFSNKSYAANKRKQIMLETHNKISKLPD